MPCVLSFGDAPADAGGWGATVVTLKGNEPSSSLPHSAQDTLKQELAATLEEFRSLVAPLSEKDLSWSPSAGQWSVAECIEHLNQTNELLLDAVDKAIEAGDKRNRSHPGPFRYGWLERWLLETVGPPPSHKFKAPKAYLPAPRPVKQILTRYEELHRRTLSSLDNSRGLDLVRIKVPSPILRWIRLSLGIQFAVIIAHNRRHLWQAREVAAAIG